jgi:hypothetical protein
MDLKEIWWDSVDWFDPVPQKRTSEGQLWQS